jgi:hypothetical protein
VLEAPPGMVVVGPVVTTGVEVLRLVVPAELV